MINHETILAQTKKDLETEKEEAVRLAVEQECTTLNKELQEAKKIISEHEQEIDAYKQQEIFLLKQQSVIKGLEMNKSELERSIASYQEKLAEQEKIMRELEVI